MTPDVINLKNDLKSKNIKGLALDIDETLSWTVGWWVEKMQDFFGNPENLTAEELVKKYKYTQNVPYWQTEEALLWMSQQIENDDIQIEFNLIENSNDIVKDISRIIPIVAYITTRPQVVATGTKKWLEKHGFPIAPIINRPSNIDPKNGTLWKAGVLLELFPQVIGIIDDNISLVQNLSKDYRGFVFVYGNLVDTQNPRIFNCSNWSEVYNKIKENNELLLVEG